MPRYSIKAADGWHATDDPDEVIRIAEQHGLPYSAIIGMAPAQHGGHLEAQIAHAHKAP